MPSVAKNQLRFRLKTRAVAYKGGQCSHCSYRKTEVALCFHHRESSEKEFTISHGTAVWERVQEELDKCDLLCLNCHAEEHDQLPGHRGVQPIPSGAADRVCTQCRTVYPTAYFYVMAGRTATECKTCFRERVNRRCDLRRDTLIAEAGGGCRVCGYKRSVSALTFHHREPAAKSFTVSMKWGSPLEVLRAEAQKCDLLCLNCHAEEHERLRLLVGPSGIAPASPG